MQLEETLNNLFVFRRKLGESDAKMRNFGSYNVLNIQDDKHRYLKYFDKII